jgi:hypothetical protein
MASDKSIAEGIAQRYVGDDRKEILGMMRKAAASARADEHRLIEKAISDHRSMLNQARSAALDRRERFKLTWSLKTLDAMVEVVFRSGTKS